ncbi:MAG: ribonuclease Y [Candidatus Pacebacteria bacterium]|nr:ribonuclease Y [Candidatus Paceibacterota bacterium]
MLTNLILGAAFLLVGLAVGYFVRQLLAAQGVNSAEQKVKTLVDEAQSQAKEIILEAKTKASYLLDEAKKEEKDQKAQFSRTEERLMKREEQLEKQQGEITGKKESLEKEASFLESQKAETEELKKKISGELEKVAKLSFEEAKKQLMEKVQETHKDEMISLIKKLEKERIDEIEKKGLGIITTALQRYARSHVADMTTSVFHLPNEELKGKIIGREGRNIKTLERLTGVEVIVDEMPDSVVLSSFDPLRREIARLSLEKLVKDGRIQPARIEEKVEEARQELNKRIQEIGDNAVLEVGVIGLPRDIVQLLGRLYFRTSFGQNVLVHSIEMAHISGMIAAELGVNVEVTKKAALLHDIGKAIDHEVEGTHVEIGRKLLKKYSIDENVVKAMESHHEEYPFASPESYIIAAADVLSAARPGARRGTIENYIKRLQDLEKIATGFEGVKNAYAVSAGREIRVFVVPEKIDDFGALQLAKDIASKIESELKYPGEVKVTVIREMRAVEVAR